MDFIIKIFSDSLYFTGPILLCTLGGLFAYKANMINIGLEGMMLFGGFISALILFFTHSWIIAFIAAILLAILLGLLFSYFGVTKKANFIITGFAINLLAIAVGKYVLAALGSIDINVISDVTRQMAAIDLGIIGEIPVIGPIINKQSFLTYFSFILIFICQFVLFNTKFGTYVRVVGESEEAAKSIGISINKIKYLAVIIGALLCAFAGYNVAINQLASYTPDITAGTGFIAIAAIYCGAGNPKNSSLYAILFGLSRSLAVNLSLRIGTIAGLLEMIPYIMIIIVLTVVGIIRKRKTLYRGFLHE
ncbi:MAG: ABC transporter permease [Tenericutes bacterium HGW-Tenericutes-1]|jgi:simple sugar transport system permease protein|nr:MAG: ABC transporter permease [Tenericutes bacterium HGW-Tenericutes-1]PKM57010.1 MAG: ABC transporter permease [Firmicutes bacterium HGW-Firmicutes-3]